MWRGDARKAAKKLPWDAKIKFEELVDLMLQHDLFEARVNQFHLTSIHRMGGGDPTPRSR